MAIAVDTTGQGYANATSLTYSHTCSGSSRYLIVGWYEFTNSRTVSSVKYAGADMTLIGEQTADGSGGYVRQYGLANPASGANNIVITLSGTNQIFATSASYTGVDQTTPNPNSSTTGSVTGTGFNVSSPSVTVDQSWIAMHGRSPSRVPTADSFTVVRQTNGTSGDAGWLLDSDAGRNTGSNTLNFSYSPSATSYYVITNIAPSTGGSSGPANLKSYNTNVKSNIKSIDTNPIANIKSLNTNS
jgi:hypothetical protein